jgi:hypothetical protein
VDVLLRLGYPVVGHDLLELVLVPRVTEGVRGRVGGITCFADDGRIISAEVAAPVEVGEGDVVIGGRWDSRIRVLLVGQRLITQRLNGIGNETEPVPVLLPGPGLAAMAPEPVPVTSAVTARSNNSFRTTGPPLREPNWFIHPTRNERSCLPVGAGATCRAPRREWLPTGRAIRSPSGADSIHQVRRCTRPQMP